MVNTKVEEPERHQLLCERGKVRAEEDLKQDNMEEEPPSHATR